MITANSSSSSISVVDGYNITLSCTSSGSPPDTFTWMKDGDPTVLQSTSITAVTHDTTSAVFSIDYIIRNFSISDIGTYTCSVANPIGNDSATITVSLCKLLCVVTINFSYNLKLIVEKSHYNNVHRGVAKTNYNKHKCSLY